MVGGQSGSKRAVSQANHWPATVAALVVGAAFFALWFWLLPGWLGFRVETAGASRWRWLAAIPSVLGFAVALRCVWDFGWTGHGTPAPVAPPKRLVVVGFYRYVRNPMYVGFAAGWIGLWVVFGHANLVAIATVAAVALGVHLFVVFYEEPTLHKKFGAEYDDYCRNVGRWWPRLKAGCRKSELNDPQRLFLQCAHGNGHAQAAREARRHLDCAHRVGISSGTSVLSAAKRVAGRGALRRVCRKPVCEVLCGEVRATVVDARDLLSVAAGRILRGDRQQRGIAWRLADSLGLRRFLGIGLDEMTPDH